MKTLLCFLFCIKAFADFTYTIEPQGYFEYRLHCNAFAHTSIASGVAYFDLFNLKSCCAEEGWVPQVIYKPAGVGKSYSYTDERDHYIEGSASIFSLGTFLDRMKEFLVYNHTNHEYIGGFSGVWDTENIAEFIFHNHLSQPIAIAVISKERQTIPILDIHDREKLLAHLIKHHNRFKDGSVEYFWEVKMERLDAIPSELLHIFTAFVVETYFTPFPTLFTGAHMGL